MDIFEKRNKTKNEWTFVINFFYYIELMSKTTIQKYFGSVIWLTLLNAEDCLLNIWGYPPSQLYTFQTWGHKICALKGRP